MFRGQGWPSLSAGVPAAGSLLHSPCCCPLLPFSAVFAGASCILCGSGGLFVSAAEDTGTPWRCVFGVGALASCSCCLLHWHPLQKRVGWVVLHRFQTGLREGLTGGVGLFELPTLPNECLGLLAVPLQIKIRRGNTTRRVTAPPRSFLLPQQQQQLQQSFLLCWSSGPSCASSPERFSSCQSANPRAPQRRRWRRRRAKRSVSPSAAAAAAAEGHLHPPRLPL